MEMQGFGITQYEVGPAFVLPEGRKVSTSYHKHKDYMGYNVININKNEHFSPNLRLDIRLAVWLKLGLKFHFKNRNDRNRQGVMTLWLW
jgi:hypothetical protein